MDRRTLLHRRYVIQRIIGQGGMGAVYQAKDLKRQGMICAIKEMSLSMVPPAERPQAIQNFKIEAKILWGLNHPNLPSFTGFFAENQRYFLVMEYIDGYTLEELLERNNGPFSERRVLGWARQLCDVLEYLHSQSPPIIFRDMKPGNVMLTRNGHIKLIDFGIARFFRPTGAQDTQLLGTPGFAPPEQYGKAQTDVRSDIYSLAMTLFQLLTNTLPDTGFGLKDVRVANRQISPVVARALEKAAALEQGERFSTIAEFRNALLGYGTFVFENGDVATTPQELADLCARYPEEASDYIASGEVELWLQEIGARDLARAAERIRMTISDPMEAVERFLKAAMGPNARIRNATMPKTPGASSISAQPAIKFGSSYNSFSWLTRKAPSPIQVSPRTLDYGEVYPGISAPLTITITGDQGLLVSGTIQPSHHWILVDQTHFDGMSTIVNVRINSTQLRGSTHYTGAIAITPNNDGKEIVVTVEVDVLGYTTKGNKANRRGKTVGADLDDDEDDDALTMGSQVMMPPGTKTTTATNQKNYYDIAALPSTVKTRDSEHKAKYGQPGAGSSSQGWDPLQATPQQRLWQQRGLAFAAALMAASLVYTLPTQLQQTPPLPPSSWFVLVLTGIVPAATLGALLVNGSGTRSFKEWLNRACTGMGSALVFMAIIKFAWQLIFHGSLPLLQLVVMLTVASLGATLGTSANVSQTIIQRAEQALVRMRGVVITVAVIIGGILGYFLTAGLALDCFTPFGILIGIGVMVALVLRVDQLVKRNRP
ncbi:MAG TPA: serine/threonine-protein kinase [Ktedonosporobacter sp.]|nr:serine/threonine-protein kinase [Ktedonosporobacter sp.]